MLAGREIASVGRNSDNLPHFLVFVPFVCVRILTFIFERFIAETVRGCLIVNAIVNKVVNPCPAKNVISGNFCP